VLSSGGWQVLGGLPANAVQTAVVLTPRLLLVRIVLVVMVVMMLMLVSLGQFLLGKYQRGTIFIQPYRALFVHHRGLDVGKQWNRLRQRQ